LLIYVSIHELWMRNEWQSPIKFRILSI
jgi:hypothetical protein